MSNRNLAISPLLRASALLLVLSIGAKLTYAIDKGAIAYAADQVVVAKLKNTWAIPWIDGWHFWGTLQVTRVLWGPTNSGSSLKYRFACRSCPLWPRPDLESISDREGIWFVRNSSGHSWEPAFGPNSDPSFRPIADLAYYENLLSKRQTAGHRAQ